MTATEEEEEEEGEEEEGENEEPRSYVAVRSRPSAAPAVAVTVLCFFVHDGSVKAADILCSSQENVSACSLVGRLLLCT